MNTSRSRVWCFDPHSGGVKIAAATKPAIEARLQACFAKLGFAKSYRLDVRFRGALCYVDAYALEPDAVLVRYWVSQGMDAEAARKRFLETSTKLGRLRHFAMDRWSYAFFTYSHERYEATTLNGEWTGLPEQGLEIGCRYLENGNR